MGASHVLDLGDALALAVSARYVVRPVTKLGHTDMKQRVLGVEMDSPVQRYNLIDKSSGACIAAMSIQIMPGCCGVVVFHTFYGKAKPVQDFIKFGMIAAQRKGFGLVLYTLREESPLIQGLDEDDENLHPTTFRNGKTDHEVVLLSRILKQEARKAIIPPTAGE